MRGATLSCFLFFSVFLICTPAVFAHDVVKHLIPELEKEAIVNKENLHHLFNLLELQSARSPTTKECGKIRTRITGNITALSLELGADYYAAHKSIFNRTETLYGVPPEIILSILRRETVFGNCLGDQYAFAHLVREYARATSEKKRRFFFVQIRELLKIGEKEGWNTEKLLNIPSSIAGAFGLPHFLPQSFKHATDGNKDGVIDLFNPDDAIPSIAHYLVYKALWKETEQSRTRAIFDYNPDKIYVNLIFEYAEAIRKHI